MTEPKRVRQPGDREVAPGRLALVQSFVNSVNVEFGPDEFASLDGLTRWMERQGFRPDLRGTTESDRREVVEVREALRALMRENNGAPADPEARPAVGRAAADCPWSWPSTRPGPPVCGRPEPAPAA